MRGRLSREDVLCTSCLLDYKNFGGMVQVIKTRYLDRSPEQKGHVLGL